MVYRCIHVYIHMYDNTVEALKMLSMVYRCIHRYIDTYGNTVEALQGALDGVNAVEEVLFAASILGQPPVV